MSLWINNFNARALSLNLLEFIASKATIYIKLKLLQVENMEYWIKMHFFTDISSALGCMHHSIFNSIRDKYHDKVEMSLARYVMDFKSSVIYQNIKGDHSYVLESLSRDFHLSTQKNHSPIVKSSTNTDSR